MVFLGLRHGFLAVLFISLISAVFAAEPWDFLREPINWLWVVEPLVLWVLLFVALGLFVISILAYRKKRSEKLAWVSAAFGLFFLKALLLVIDIYYSPGDFVNKAVAGFFDLLIIGSLFIGLFRK